MERLAQRDLRALLEFLRQGYALRDFDGFVAHLLKALPKVVPSEVASYHEMNVSRASSKNWVEPAGVDTPAQARAWERVMHDHPILAHYQRTRDGRALKISDFLTDSQFHRLALYNEHYRVMRTDRMMGFVFSASRSATLGVGLQRGGRDFTERERLLLNLLRPHLVQAYENAKAVTQMRKEMVCASRALEALGHGLITLTPDGRIAQATARARHFVAEYFASRSRQPRRLPEVLRRWIDHQEALLAQESDAPPPREPLVVDRDGKRLVVRLVSDFGQSLLLLEEQRTRVDSRSFESLGLTQREAEVLSWVAEGKTNAEIGIILGARPRTVEKHLERIFRKLGVETKPPRPQWPSKRLDSLLPAIANVSLPSPERPCLTDPLVLTKIEK